MNVNGAEENISSLYVVHMAVMKPPEGYRLQKRPQLKKASASVVLPLLENYLCLPPNPWQQLRFHNGTVSNGNTYTSWVQIQLHMFQKGNI